MILCGLPVMRLKLKDGTFIVWSGVLVHVTRLVKEGVYQFGPKSRENEPLEINLFIVFLY